MEEQKKPLVMILGPTASGKSALSLRLAGQFKGEIISADSMQVYRGMDIGTAKLSKAEMLGIPHHLIDILDPAEKFSVADFALEATSAIRNIDSRHKLPLVVGGTGLYMNALINPYNLTDTGPRDGEYRLALQAEFLQDGGLRLHQQLTEIDPVAAAKIHPHDSRRLLRALEVYHFSGRPISQLQQENKAPAPYRLLMIGLTMGRERLHQRIAQRVEQMLHNGLTTEVEGLLQAGIGRDAQSMQGIGYRHIAAYLYGEMTYGETVELIKRDTRHYAKRQYTWFKRDERIHWFNLDHYPEEDMLVAEAALLLKTLEEE
ncbi:MAG: tRNA (adenosine(37)-N6)-dimethylallyltransferase MiaA [Clostridiales bacterium]